MPDMRHWMSRNTIVAPVRAEDAWQRIQDAPVRLVLLRGEIEQPAQIVRVEVDNADSEVAGNAGTSGKRGATVFGIKGHSMLTDTDLRRGDKFSHNGLQYRVISVVYTMGEVQARSEALS